MKLRSSLSTFSAAGLLVTFVASMALWHASAAQQPRIDIIAPGTVPNVAVTDFRATGAAQQFMSTFNSTVQSDLQSSPLVKFVPKTEYPLQVPQTPTDLQTTPAPNNGQPINPNGLRVTDWGLPPVSANFLGFGYGADQNGQLVVFGYFYSTLNTIATLQQAQVFAKPYIGTLDEDGARRLGHQYASDILAQFGGKSLIGSRIIFVSDRSGSKEIWSMSYDGTDQHQLTRYGTISNFPSVSADGKKLAFTSWLHGQPEIVLLSLETNRRLPFYNQHASMNAFVDFFPDGQHVMFSSTVAGGPSQLYSANIDGGNLQRITSSNAIAVEPKINPKTGADVVFVSGRSGLPQIYKMNVDGADVQRLSNGEGEATNPAWAPNGAQIAFAWTKGFEPGNYNIFIMDVTSRNIVQLTSNEGRNENPSWAPDNAHIAFASKRGKVSQIWVMLANGTAKQQLTTQGNNEKPVWIPAIQ
jgi:TolB protein